MTRGPTSPRIGDTRCLSESCPEAKDVSVRVGDGALSLSVILVLGAVHFDLSLPPLVGHPVGLLAVDVESTVTRRFAAASVRKVDREVAIPMGEGIGVIVERHVESGTLEPGGRAGHVGNLEDRLEPRDQPRARHELQLAVSLAVSPARQSWQIGSSGWCAV